jgi:hypothetical protein
MEWIVMAGLTFGAAAVITGALGAVLKEFEDE